MLHTETNFSNSWKTAGGSPACLQMALVSPALDSTGTAHGGWCDVLAGGGSSLNWVPPQASQGQPGPVPAHPALCHHCPLCPKDSADVDIDPLPPKWSSPLLLHPGSLISLPISTPCPTAAPTLRAHRKHSPRSSPAPAEGTRVRLK